MKKVFAFLLMIIGCLMIPGCESTEEDIELTQDERNLLVGVWIDEANLDRGHLTNPEKFYLEQCRACLEYLKEKYPDTEFTFVNFSSASIMREYGSILFYEKGDDETQYFVECRETEQGYEMVDSYYGKILEPLYDEKIHDIFSECIDAEFAVYTVFPHKKGFEVNGNTTVDELFAMEDSIQKDIFVFIDTKDGDLDKAVILDKLEKKLREYHQYEVSCKVHFIPGILEKCQNGYECREYIKENFREDFDRVSFNTFKK
ncbi:MAG: hypothetical protein ACI4L2_09310 [Wujia sp.]